MQVRENVSGLRQFLGPAKSYRRMALPILVAALLVQLFALISPLLSQLIVNHATGVAASAEGIYVVIGYALVTATAAIAELIRSLWVAAVQGRLESDTYPRAFAGVFGAMTREPIQVNSSEVISRFQSLRTTNQVIGNVVIEGVVDTLYVMTILVALMVYDRTIALVAMGAVIVYAMCRLLVGRHLSRTTREIAQTDAAQVNYLKDEADAHQSVRFFNAHEGRLGGWTTLVGRRVQKEAARARTTAYLRCIQQFSVGAISVITIAVGVTRVSAGELSLGAMFALVGLTFAMFSRVTMLTERLSSFDLLGVHWRRFRELAHSDQPTPAGFVAVRPGTPTKGSGVYLNRLKVDLGGRTILNLEPVACAVGKLTVVTGRSGEGKTTLIRALAGIVPTVTADVELVFDWPSDAVRHGVLSVREWSSQCSACFQGDALFENVSIAQNIACYDPIVDAVRVAFAARLACIATEIETVLGGYDGPVVARIMSQGQAQRLLLARALYRTPKVLLLDEATSALDEAMERQVIENVMKTGCTVIAVAHRKQWIRAAHQVYDLSNGMLHSVHPTPESIDAALYP